MQQLVEVVPYKAITVSPLDRSTLFIWILHVSVALSMIHKKVPVSVLQLCLNISSVWVQQLVKSAANRLAVLDARACLSHVCMSTYLAF